MVRLLDRGVNTGEITRASAQSSTVKATEKKACAIAPPSFLHLVSMAGKI
jgi:hypothetical protein